MHNYHCSIFNVQLNLNFLVSKGGASHGDSRAVDKTDFVAVGYGMTVDEGIVLVLVVAKHGLQASIWQSANGDESVLTTHVAVGGVYLKGGLRCLGLTSDGVIAQFQLIGSTIALQNGLSDNRLRGGYLRGTVVGST